MQKSAVEALFCISGSIQKRIDHLNASDIFTGIEIFAQQSVAASRLGVRQNAGIVKSQAANLMQVKPGSYDGRRNLHNFKLLVEVKLSPHMLG